MRMVGLVLLVLGCFAVVVNLVDPVRLAAGGSPSPNPQGLLVWGVVAVIGGLLRYYAKPKDKGKGQAESGEPAEPKT